MQFWSTADNDHKVEGGNTAPGGIDNRELLIPSCPTNRLQHQRITEISSADFSATRATTS
ncbi:hypothetical protein A8144_09980 [Mycobacterium leprae 3125609]|nr:hypothetical protein A8144_09980 [Mycobacterium leprae 3125609]OAX70872.1 hypothetical protein A3216_09465 [Mycobacterium leprae 7935681]